MLSINITDPQLCALAKDHSFPFPLPNLSPGVLEQQDIVPFSVGRSDFHVKNHHCCIAK